MTNFYKRINCIIISAAKLFHYVPHCTSLSTTYAWTTCKFENMEWAQTSIFSQSLGRGRLLLYNTSFPWSSIHIKRLNGTIQMLQVRYEPNIFSVGWQERQFSEYIVLWEKLLAQGQTGQELKGKTSKAGQWGIHVAERKRYWNGLSGNPQQQ